MIRYLGRLLANARPSPPADPIPPVNVRLVINGDPPIPCELAYEGLDGDRMHLWTATAPIRVTRNEARTMRVALLAESIPPHTAIRTRIIVEPEEPS